jgi:hypothetical protein
MAITPNTDFSSGAILTAQQQNNFPRGIMAYAESSTNYTLTTSAAVATGMTATFTAVANRYYKVTYFEPQAQLSSTATALTVLQIRLTNAAGTQLKESKFQQAYSGGTFNQTMICQAITTFTAGSITVVGCALANIIAGGPILTRAATSTAFITVEDMGPA